MASVVFFRAINVGGHQRCQPSNLARDLAALDVVNVGAAGTLVVRKAVSQASLRKEILRRLHFEPELMICPGQEVMALATDDPFGKAPSRSRGPAIAARCERDAVVGHCVYHRPAFAAIGRSCSPS